MRRSRRWFLWAFPGGIPALSLAASVGKRRLVPPAVYRYSDPATEFPVTRLTDPAYTSIAPAHYNRAIARRGNYLLYSSNLTGAFQAYRMDLRDGASQPLTDSAGLDPATLTFSPDDREIYCIADGRLLQIRSRDLRSREIYRIPEGFKASGGMSLSADGREAALVEKQGMHFRLRLVNLAEGSAATASEADEEMRDPICGPRGAGILYRRGSGLWLVSPPVQRNDQLKLSGGETGPATWSSSGRSIFYLNYPADPHRLHNIREYTLDTNEDKAVADTTQYIAFERNGDSSVFAGASGSKASPYVLLLVRAVKRELTLCEHHSSDPRIVSPVFSPDSQHVFFGSDRHGHPALYSLAVEKLVARTDSNP